jgi:hypothetical protein
MAGTMDQKHRLRGILHEMLYCRGGECEDGMLFALMYRVLWYKLTDGSEFFTAFIIVTLKLEAVRK